MADLATDIRPYTEILTLPRWPGSVHVHIPACKKNRQLSRIFYLAGKSYI